MQLIPVVRRSTTMSEKLLVGTALREPTFHESYLEKP